MARLPSTRQLIRDYRRSLLGKLVAIALAYQAHNFGAHACIDGLAALEIEHRSLRKTHLFDLPLDVLLLILTRIAEKEFGKHADDMTLLFRFAVAHADSWRSRIHQRESITVQKLRNTAKPSLRFKEDELKDRGAATAVAYDGVVMHA